jgi:ribosomal protein S6E (S10)
MCQRVRKYSREKVLLQGKSYFTFSDDGKEKVVSGRGRLVADPNKTSQGTAIDHRQTQEGLG